MEAAVQLKREILRPTDVAHVLGVRRSRVYALLRLGVLPCVRVAGAIWIPRAALDEWLNEQAQRALAAARKPEQAGENH